MQTAGKYAPVLISPVSIHLRELMPILTPSAILMPTSMTLPPQKLSEKLTRGGDLYSQLAGVSVPAWCTVERHAGCTQNVKHFVLHWCLSESIKQPNRKKSF